MCFDVFELCFDCFECHDFNSQLRFISYTYSLYRFLYIFSKLFFLFSTRFLCLTYGLVDVIARVYHIKVYSVGWKYCVDISELMRNVFFNKNIKVLLFHFENILFFFQFVFIRLNRLSRCRSNRLYLAFRLRRSIEVRKTGHEGPNQVT